MSDTQRALLEQALALREELARRRADDPLLSFQPHKKQQKFIDEIMSRKYKRGFFLAANRAGKSQAGAAVVAQALRFGWPDSETVHYSPDMTVIDRSVSVWCSSLDWPSSRDIVQPKLFDNGYGVKGRGNEPFIPQREIQQWVPSQQILKLKSGSICGFKCLRGDQDVLLADGTYKPISDIRVGDHVAVRTRHGKKGQRDRTAAVDVKYDGKIAPLLRLKLSGGRELVCSAEHQIFNGLRWKQAGEYKERDEIPYLGTPEPEQPVPLKYSPWLLGFMIGDGGFTGKNIRVTVADERVKARVAQECEAMGFRFYKLDDRYTYAITLGRSACAFTAARDGRGYALAGQTSPLLDWLRDLGLWGKKSKEKHVPDDVFRAPNAEVAAFLSGLFAADGTITTKPSASYATSSRALAAGVQRLLDRFAIRSTLQFIRQTDSWRVVTCGRLHLGRFLRAVEWVKYPEKAARHRDYPDTAVAQKLYVQGIEKVPAAPVYDLDIPGLRCYMAQGILVHNSNDSGREKYQGTGKDLIWFDEEHDKDVYEEATIRVEAGRTLSVIVTCTLLPPEGVPGGVTWTYDDIVRPWQAGKLKDVLLITASIYDNPFIGPDEVRFLESIYPPGSLQRRIRLDGELLPGTGGARAFTSFERSLHVHEQASFWNPRRPLVWCWDFNIDPLITLIGQRDGNVFRVFDEFVTENSDLAEMCDYVYDTYGSHRGEWWVYGDQTGQHRSAQTAETNYTLIINHMRSKGVGIRLKLPHQNPMVRDRINAVNRQLKDEYGEVNVEIDPKCEELILDLEQVQLDKRGGLRKVANRSDPYFKRTHSSDAWSYWLAYEAPVTQFSSGRKFGKTSIRDGSYSFKGAQR